VLKLGQEPLNLRHAGRPGEAAQADGGGRSAACCCTVATSDRSDHTGAVAAAIALLYLREAVVSESQMPHFSAHCPSSSPSQRETYSIAPAVTCTAAAAPRVATATVGALASVGRSIIAVLAIAVLIVAVA
jgi:hypothetical protein